MPIGVPQQKTNESGFFWTNLLEKCYNAKKGGMVLKENVPIENPYPDGEPIPVFGLPGDQTNADCLPQHRKIQQFTAKNFHPPIPGRVELHSVESEITADPPPDAGSAKIPAGSFAGAGPDG